MKKIFSNISIVLAALLYLLSTMGVGVHRCGTDRSTSLLLLYGGDPCEILQCRCKKTASHEMHSGHREGDCRCHCSEYGGTRDNGGSGHCCCCCADGAKSISGADGGNCGCTTEIFINTEDQYISEGGMNDAVLMLLICPVLPLQETFRSVCCEQQLPQQSYNTCVSGLSRDICVLTGVRRI